MLVGARAFMEVDGLLSFGQLANQMKPSVQFPLLSSAARIYLPRTAEVSRNLFVSFFLVTPSIRSRSRFTHGIFFLLSKGLRRSLAFLC